MFFPLGFGHLPRRFPMAIILLFLVSLIVSFKFFPALKEIKKDTAGKNAQALLDRRFAVVELACMNKFNSPQCKEFVDRSRCGKKCKNQTGAKKTNFDLKILSYLSLFTSPAEKWPEESKRTEAYASYVDLENKMKSDYRETFASLGFATSESLKISSLLQSTFGHGDVVHLFGNMLFLLIFGIWVEQKIGLSKTLGLFIFGSFAGLILEALVHPVAILGASAGVSALKGAFFIFFYKAELIFIVGAFPFYMKRVSLPIYWTFPLLFFTDDLIAVSSGNYDGVAHLAHLGGLASGLLFGRYHLQQENLKNDELFVEEKVFYRKLKKTTDPKVLFHCFKEIMSWNIQNRRAVLVFLKRSHELSFSPSPMESKFLEKHFSLFTQKIFKQGSPEEILGWIKSLPTYVALEKCLGPVPLKQLLRMADLAAQNEKWGPALRLYEVSMKFKPAPEVRSRVQAAITELKKIQEEIGNEHSLQTSA